MHRKNLNGLFLIGYESFSINSYRSKEEKESTYDF